MLFANSRSMRAATVRTVLLLVSSMMCVRGVMAQMTLPTEPSSTQTMPAAVKTPLAASTISTCHPAVSAVFPLRLYRGHFLIDLSIEDHTLGMMVDSGAQRSTITQAAADALGLLPNDRHRVRVNGIGGTSQVNHAVTAHRIKFGGLQKLSYDLAVAELSRLGEDGDPQSPQGLVGADLLSAFDVEFDFPNLRMTLYSSPSISGCAGDFVPWSGAHENIDAALSPVNMLLIPVVLDQHPVLAMIDTGGQRTMLNSDAARAVGVDAAVLAQEPMSAMVGMNGLSVTVHQHRFAAMSVGRATFRSAPVLVQDGSMKQAEMILGLDFMRSRKLWLSYATKQVFIQHTPKPKQMPGNAQGAVDVIGGPAASAAGGVAEAPPTSVVPPH